MKLNGKAPGVNIEPIVLPRVDGDLVFKIRAIDDFEKFEAMCPPPEAPARILPGGIRIPDLEDKNYLKAVTLYSEKRLAYMVVKGLADATPELTWETVNISDSTTWPNFRKEMRDSGLSDIEINRIVNGAVVANSLSELVVQEARKRFLAQEQEAQRKSSSLKEELRPTRSGAPASVST